MMLGTAKMTKEGPLGIWVYMLQSCKGCRRWRRRQGSVDTIAVSLTSCKMVLVSLEQQTDQGTIRLAIQEVR